MFLKEISLTNFKCHDQLFLSFENQAEKFAVRKTSFLLGENGTGKSALLKAIALITAGSNALGDMLGNADEWIKQGKDFCEISATLITAKGEERKVGIKVNRNESLNKFILDNSESLDLIDRAISHADRNYFVVAYGASRILNYGSKFSRHGSEFSSPRAQNIQSLFSPNATLVSVTDWAIDLDYSGKNDGLKTVKKALDAFLVDNVKFNNIDKIGKQLIFTTPDGEMPLNQLSEGYQNVLAWVGDLMYRITETFVDHKDPLKARGLLLIDEIDLHLHPKWQRHLHAFLTTKLPNFQIIATTHSPITAQQADEDELYALRRTGRKVELIPFHGAPNKMLLHQILMSPVFGLETDESLEVETAKTKIRELTLKGRKSEADEKLIARYSHQLEDLPTNIRSNSLLDESDLELLTSIRRELKAKK